MTDAWSTPFGQYILARMAFDRARREGTLVGMVNGAPVGTPPGVGDRALALMAAHEAERDLTEDADAAFLREIAMAHEVCDEQVAADAAVAFAPDVPLPFDGDVKPKVDSPV